MAPHGKDPGDRDRNNRDRNNREAVMAEMPGRNTRDASLVAPPADWQTHIVQNQVDERVDQDLLAQDAALGEALARAGATPFLPRLSAQARWLGRAETFALAARANARGPVLETFDARGRRIDRVDFDPAWHQLLARLRADGGIALPFADRRAGRWSAWAAAFYLHGQVEAGTLCPVTMTQAAIPVLRREPALWSQLGAKLLDEGYDPSDQPMTHKRAIWVGMGMTEKQGGSDVRANLTTARADGVGGRGQWYRLRGHKWFYSAPQSDAHLVVARMGEGGLSCFLVPRWLPDGQANSGSLNGVRIQRLKDKLGNRSNASSEVEFQDAAGMLIGEPGRGIPTIIEMAGYTRLNCVLGSAAIMRQALVQAIAYARGRQAFGRALLAQPLMATVLADLALETEAALVLGLRLAQAFEADEDADTADPLQRAWKRIITPAAKGWVCKRAVEMTGEAMEVLGGNGYIDSGIMARLFREAPVNSIWEGSGNVMCLDVLRAIEREPALWQALQQDLADHGGQAELTGLQASLRAEPAEPAEVREAAGRAIVGRLVLLAQAVLLQRHAPAVVAHGFIAARIGPQRSMLLGAADIAGADAAQLIDRALPA